MSYRRDGDTIKLELTADDYDSLLIALGYATSRYQVGTRLFWRWLALANRINEGNPSFTPYEIPAKFLHVQEPAGNKEHGTS